MQKYLLITSTLEDYRDVIGEFWSEVNELRDGIQLWPAMDVDAVRYEDGTLVHSRIPWGYRDFHPHREWFIDKRVILNNARTRGFGEDFAQRRCVVLADAMMLARVKPGEHAVDYRFRLKSGKPFVLPAMVGSHGGLGIIGDYGQSQAHTEFGPGMPIIIRGQVAVQRYLSSETSVPDAWDLLGGFNPDLYEVMRAA